MKYQNQFEEYVELLKINSSNQHELIKSEPDEFQLFWFLEDDNILKIDGEERPFNKNEIVFLTNFNKIEIISIQNTRVLRFNKAFYCIKNSDSEVACNGLLFYGSNLVPTINPDKNELHILNITWEMAGFEFEMADNLQHEMLQMMLKRILILCTRIYKKQYQHYKLNVEQHNLVRSFNYLVETHFKDKHLVGEYAEMLNKSPKTISNLFKKLGKKSPLQVIQDRIMLEAKRNLWHTKEDVSQIAYDLGFADLQSFSRFYKKNKGISPSDCRAQYQA